MNIQKPRRAALATTSTLAILTAIGVLSAATGAWAQDATNGQGADAEGTQVKAVIITAERSKAAESAPSKASVDETQPEAIITHKFIELATPETGGWVSVSTIAPSVSGITANGGGVGETTKLTLRGFQDGQFNLTYDGIAFGDTNGPTHHQASYWPASTIGAVVIDRGPGAAGDLGPANYGGAIHFFSPEVEDTFGGFQKFTYGSFDTYAAVTRLNTGPIAQLGGIKVLANFDERWSAGELSDSGGEAQNQLLKVVVPLSPKWDMTLFASHNYTRFYQSDAGPGETWAQVQSLGKNFALDGNPNDEHYYKYNPQSKQTDFEYVDFKGELTSSTHLEDQYYTYFYTNKTHSVNSIVDTPGGPNTNSFVNNPQPGLYPGQAATDIGGYDKLNQYRVNGDVVRLNQELPFGTLKVGGVYEWSTTDRHNLLEDFTNGYTPDDKFTPSNYPGPLTNAKTQENSAWQDYQLFADFYWRPTDSLTITPGIKYVQEHLEVDAANENVAGATFIPVGKTTPKSTKNVPLVASGDYSSPLYFLTANYKITPYWSVYGQFATSFLYPNISALYFNGANLQGLQPQRTKSYQTGMVYSRGQFTADADVYRIDATNLQQTCIVNVGGATDSEACNAGSARYTGVEGQAAYAFDQGLTLFANGGSNVAKQLANAANSAAGIAANPAEELQNAPRWTYAAGAILNHGPWQASVSYKNSGAYVVYGGATTAHLPGYDSIDASGAYDFGRFKIKLQGFNLADKRAITSYAPVSGGSLYDTKNATDYGLYEFQAGREIDLTLEAKF